jgi:hypothetical protein
MFDSDFDPFRFILENQESIIEHFFNIKLDGKNIICLFREDKNPTCGFYYAKTGRLYYHDFKTGDNFDAVGMVMNLKKINRSQALKLILDNKQRYTKKEKKAVEERIYSYLEHENFSYFEKYYISKRTLNYFRVKAIKTLYINGNVYKRWRDLNPIFSYGYSSKRQKFYRPITKNDDKWFGDSNHDDVFGLERLPWVGQTVIITSSAKDTMVLKELGFNAINFDSETISLRNTTIKSTLSSLKRRFKYLFVYMDNDAAGLATNKKISEFIGAMPLVNPYSFKDVSDHCKHYGLKTTKRMVEKMISKQVRNYVIPNVTFDVPF